MSSASTVSLVVGLGSCLYSYVGYPALLKLLGLGRARRRATPPFEQWPSISITIPVHNEAEVIAGTLERLLELDYPVERRQILVVSDASSDGTDDIVSRFVQRGVELLRLPERRGKTAAENAARGQLRGDIIINTDASVRIDRRALKLLVAEFADPAVGVASGRDVSVAHVDAAANAGESAYIGYEMWVRDLETRVAGIVGASGCLYAIRAELHREPVPGDLSRDFGAALFARRRGFRAVSVPQALCCVPRSASLRQEYRRKVRTMARGLRTLWALRALLNPLRYGVFAWMLCSHKLCRWLVPWASLLAVGAVGVLAPDSLWARAVLGAAVGVLALAAVGWWWPVGPRRVPRIFALPAYAVSGNVAALHAWLLAFSSMGTAVWEPTRRGEPAETARLL